MCLLNINSIWSIITVEGGVNEKFIAPSPKTYSLENRDRFAALGFENVLVFVIMAEEVGNPVVTLKLPSPEIIAVVVPVAG